MKKFFKRIALGAGTLGIIIGAAAAFSAFEAHVINVTAQIENGLSVDTSFIDFGTVFPQEHLEQEMGISLSDSFMGEDRVDDIEYFIRQKPKCAITSDGGQSIDLTVDQETGGHAFTGSGHVVIGDNATTTEVVEEFFVDCGEPPRPLVEGEVWEVLPDLCPYISKDGETNDVDPEGGVDGITPSFHTPFVVSSSTITWLDTQGRLAKSINDTEDNWVIDLAVPCFGGFCAQDWADFVAEHNPQANPDDFTQPIENEHKVFGCDLWIEVSGVSENETPPEDEGTLTIQKITVDEQGAATTTDLTTFSFAVDGGTTTAFEADGSNDMTVSAGAHVVTEPTVNPDFAFLDFGGDCDDSGNVIVSTSTPAVCTITNQRSAAPTGTLTIQKITVDGEGQPVIENFTTFSFAVDGGANTAFEADGSNDMVTTAGAHVVTEPVINGDYLFDSFGGDCDAGGNVNVPASGTATCTITNELQITAD